MAREESHHLSPMIHVCRKEDDAQPRYLFTQLSCSVYTSVLIEISSLSRLFRQHDIHDNHVRLLSYAYS